MRRLIRAVPLVCGWLVVLTAPAAAQVYDAVSDFSATTNTDTSIWSYRYKPDPIRDGNYSLLPTYGPIDGTWAPATSMAAWRTATQGPPYIGVNQTGSDQTYVSGPQFVWPNGTMDVHPGSLDNNQNELVVLSWLSPLTSLVNIRLSFSSLDPNGGLGIQWYVERNSAIDTLASGSYLDGGTSGVVTLSAIPVAAGDRINFIVGETGTTNVFDSTELTAMISPVPEPGSLALCGLALGGLAVRALRRRWA